MNRPLRVLLVAFNARFTHTNPAVRSITAYVRQRLSAHFRDGRLRLDWVELTVNDPLDECAARLFEQRADVYLFSTYIWNVDRVMAVSGVLKKARPDALIGCGGPEAAHRAAAVLTQHPHLDFVLRGEGEVPVTVLLEQLGPALSAGRRPGCRPGRPHPDCAGRERAWEQDWEQAAVRVPGMVCRCRSGALLNGPEPEPVCLDDIPFLWGSERDAADWAAPDGLQNRMIYYESSRGCPFCCTYCLSAADTGVRFRRLDLVLPELDDLVRREAMLIKFVDRSFNARPDRALVIWRHLIEGYRPGQRTRFHFEIEADLLDAAAIDLLSTAPAGLFQFEIGVQTTNPAVLAAVCRRQDMARLSEAVRALRRRCGIHLHLDLIAGLPGETLGSFRRSFNDLYALGPHVIQLGFLKILSGTPMAADAVRRGFVWRDEPPYEIIASDAMTYGDLIRLKRVEAVLDRFYNQPWLSEVWAAAVGCFETPFDACSALADEMRRLGLAGRRLSAEAWYAALFVFGLGLDWPAARGACASPAGAAAAGSAETAAAGVASPADWTAFFERVYRSGQTSGRLSWERFWNRHVQPLIAG